MNNIVSISNPADSAAIQTAKMLLGHEKKMGELVLLSQIINKHQSVVHVGDIIWESET